MSSKQANHYSNRVTRLGSGRPMVVLHGGPGLASTYLRPHLDFISDFRELIYLDQVTEWKTSEQGAMTYDRYVEDLFEMIQSLSLEGDAGFVAHSFGSHLLLRVLDEFKALRVADVIVFNPLPTALTGLTLVTETMMKFAEERLSSDDKAERIAMRSGDRPFDGDRYMKILSPLYVQKAEFISQLKWGVYSDEIGQAVISTVPNYDLSELLKGLPKRSLLILGDQDFCKLEFLSDWRKAVSNELLLNDVGHSAFLEARENVCQRVAEFCRS